MDSTPATAWKLLAAIAPLAAMTSYAAIRATLGSRLRQRAMDLPNERSLHSAPTPRIGGMGFALALIVCAAVAAALGVRADAPLLAALAGYAALALVSLLDDLFGLPALPRLLAHLLVAALAAATLGLGLAWLPLLVLGLAWCANLFNFMDGADGIAGGMALLGFGAYALAAAAAGHVGLALLCGTLAAAGAAFLAFNLPPARIFMGDGGSVPLGFCAGFVGVYGALQQIWPPWFAPMVFFPFLFDATLTLALRALRGASLGQAHREHLYQRAILGGLSHRQLLLRFHTLTIACCLLAAVVFSANYRIAGLIIMLQFVVGFVLYQRLARPNTH